MHTGVGGTNTEAAHCFVLSPPQQSQVYHNHVFALISSYCAENAPYFSYHKLTHLAIVVAYSQPRQKLNTTGDTQHEN